MSKETELDGDQETGRCNEDSPDEQETDVRSFVFILFSYILNNMEQLYKL